MIVPRRLRLWMESWLRARRYARADKPSHPAPAWIRDAESFSLLDSNPMSSIAAGKVCFVEKAGRASRLLGTYAIELQQAADSLEASRTRLLLAEKFASSRKGLDPSEFAVVEIQRRALSMEREALCLLAAALRSRYGTYHSDESADPTGMSIDKPQSLLNGLTLLAYFVAARRIDVVELLIEAGARPDAVCQDDSTALAIASLKAESIPGSGPAAAKAAGILHLLEAASLASEVAPAPFSPPRRI